MTLRSRFLRSRPVSSRAKLPVRWLFVLASLLLLAPTAWAAADTGKADVTGRRGERVSHTVSSTAPSVPGKLDLVLLVDLSQSYENDLPIISAQLPGLLGELGATSDLRFGLAGFIDQFRVYSPLTSDLASAAAAADQLPGSMTGGEEKWMDALLAALTSFKPRSDAKTVFVLATDEQATLEGGRDENVVASRFAGTGVRIIGLIPDDAMKDKVNQPLLPGEIATVTRATQGSIVPVRTDSSDLGEAILKGLRTLPVDMSARLLAGCPAENVTVSPQEYRGLQASTPVDFQVSFDVPDAAPLGQSICTVDLGNKTVEFVIDVKE